MSLLYYCPCSIGGIADYAHRQAQALSERGETLTLLCPNKFAHHYTKSAHYKFLPELIEPPIGHLPSRLGTVVSILSNIQQLCKLLEKGQYQRVLFATYAEYLAPLWAWQLRHLHKQGICFGAVIHDPVRHFQVGPRWWHYWSIAEAYSFLDLAFIHSPLKLDTKGDFPNLKTVVIPCGPYEGFRGHQSKQITRHNLEIPLDATVLLAFGHLRDEKNLDLLIQALTDFEEVYLIVAGKAQTSYQKPVSFYQDLATQLGLMSRCRFIDSFIADDEVGDLFVACDHVVVTYGKHFYSASSVLNVAVSFHKTCLASSGPGNLQYSVQNYGLGVWVEPDNVSTIRQGLDRLLTDSLHPQWSRYEQENSWAINAENVIKAFSQFSQL